MKQLKVFKMLKKRQKDPEILMFIHVFCTNGQGEA